jgi:hypothetical protein
MSKKEKAKQTDSLIRKTISHSYELKNNEVILKEVTQVFTYYPNLFLMIVGEENNTACCYPPIITEWLNNFARNLSPSDSTKLGISDGTY